MSSRTITLSEKSKKALSQLLQILRRNPSFSGDMYLFGSQKRDDKPMTRWQAWNILKKAYAKSELTGKLGTHTMRKTFAARAYEYYKHDVFKVQQALGQKNINSTTSYLSFDEEEIDNFINSL